MHLNEEQVTVVVVETAKKLVKEYDTKPLGEQQRIKESLNETLIPMLRALPENTQPEELIGHLDVVRLVGEEILLGQIRNSGVIDPNDFTEEELREQINEEVLRSVVGSLLIVTEAALTVLPKGDFQEMQELAENFTDLDLDEEFKKLFE